MASGRDSSETFKSPPQQHDKWSAPDTSDSDDASKVVRLSSWHSDTNRGNIDDDVIMVPSRCSYSGTISPPQSPQPRKSSSSRPETSSRYRDTSACSSSSQPGQHSIPQPPFKTPPKLQSIEQVMNNNSGTDMASLRNLAIALAKDAIFGREEMSKSSLSGRKTTAILSPKKLDYIKTLIRTRIPKQSAVEFEYVWSLCRGSLSKSCQTLRNSCKRML